MSLLGPFKDLAVSEFQSEWKSPSNIAFVKYWGKKAHQIPANPSVSMTLNQCLTQTKVSFTPSDKMQVALKLDGVEREDFAQKIQKYLISLEDELPFLQNVSFAIETKNTFPHGTGIASSASGMSAFALNLTTYLYKLAGLEKDDLFLKRASDLSRLASGSASRSVFGGFNTWGSYSESDSSDKFASAIEVHPDLSFLHDSILIVSSHEKKVSSTHGHSKMGEHYFAQARYKQAHEHFSKALWALKAGEMDELGLILEKEALALHAMMMTSPDYYMLMRPNSLKIMELIWDFRQSTQIPLYFTLDAGPNLHLIYPDFFKNKVQTFIATELTNYTEMVIHDFTGKGPAQCL